MSSVESIRALMVRLRDLICLAYKENEFQELVFLYVTEFDYAGLSGKDEYKKKVLETIAWAQRFGEVDFVLKLARLVSQHRPSHEPLKKLVQALEKEVNPQDVAPAGSAEPLAERALPAAITSSLALYEFMLPELVFDLRPKLRATSHRLFDLPDRFHLSASAGRRLLSVLALEAEPDTRYLRWLSERVMVEKPFAGFTAAQALAAATLKLPTDEVARLRSALNETAVGLDGLVETEDDEPAGFDIAARKRQLQLAISLLDMRSRKWSALTPENLTEFLTAFAGAFDSAGIDQLCRNQLQTSLKWLANPNDPIELIVVNVVVTARDKGWLPDLAHAAYAERQDNMIFAKVSKLFSPILGAVA